MEDKELIRRVFTNGGIALWFRDIEPRYLSHATGQSSHYLLDMAYTSAQHLYAHFYQEKTVLDWYRPDRNAVIRLLHTLAGFDFRDIDRDIIGAVYNEYVEAEHKHESGLYYTPKAVVEYMLDRVGYVGPPIIGKKLIDLSAGSGRFLVSAARRLIDAHRSYYRSLGDSGIPADKVHHVLRDIRDCLFGIDLNPFACALAETNLLIQVVDLIGEAMKKNELAVLDRFHVYHSDTLTFSEEAEQVLRGTLHFSATELPEVDQIKAGVGTFDSKFDFVVGNPPYVKADENEFSTGYRARIKEHPLGEVQRVLKFKWDLFIPFVAQSYALIAPGGKMALITSSAVETVPYAAALREMLVSDSTVEEIHFFPGVKLFRNVSVFNTIFVVEKKKSEDSHCVRRCFHSQAPGDEDNVQQETIHQTKGEQIFRQNLPTLRIHSEGWKLSHLMKSYTFQKGWCFMGTIGILTRIFSLKNYSRISTKMMKTSPMSVGGILPISELLEFDFWNMEKTNESLQM